MTGALPNVPAYIAGTPLTMRRKTRLNAESGPIAVIVDLTTWAGITVEQIKARGAATMALVRILARRRPVELWAGCLLDADGRNNPQAILTKIDTAPLDLSSAAYILTSAAFPRMLCYSIGHAIHDFDGSWPFNNSAVAQKHMADIVAPGFAHVTKTLCIPTIRKEDHLGKGAEKWIEDRLAETETITLGEDADAA